MTTPFKFISFAFFNSIFCNALAFPPEINLGDLDGQNGFVINGEAWRDYSGYALDYAGDVNGDGLADLIIGAPGARPNNQTFAGKAYVIFGSKLGYPSSFELSDINGSNGFSIHGIAADDSTGSSVSAAGDVNGDGFDDLIIGARGASPNGVLLAGKSYVIYGSDSGFPNPFDLSTLNGQNGFVINGVNNSDRAGSTVSAAGDINDDGIHDLMVAAVLADPNNLSKAGIVYVIFGDDDGFSSPFELSSLNGSNGFAIHGIDEHNELGRSLSYAGDFNADGIDDVIIGAFLAEANGAMDAGQSYLIFGSDTGFTHPLELSSLNGTNGLVLNGAAAFDEAGIAVSTAGDVNGDGIADVIIGADHPPFPQIGGEAVAGNSYVVFGSDSGFTHPLELAGLDGSNGFAIESDFDFDGAGFAVSQAGDLNWDGIDDLIVGAYAADHEGLNDVGSSYVIFGSETGFPNPLTLSTLNGSNGFVAHGSLDDERTGSTVSHAGDVNGDGVDDVIIGAQYANANGILNSGRSYVVFGRKPDLIIAHDFEAP